ncbi:MAG: type II toxin-antitoxin system HicA family toxin, partial [Parachlamydiaceae bacterium]|nr:type II toxin-antitoxin system HicA family toxin [Parachlamydiaceae bacterium]
VEEGNPFLNSTSLVPSTFALESLTTAKNAALVLRDKKHPSSDLKKKKISCTIPQVIQTFPNADSSLIQTKRFIKKGMSLDELNQVLRSELGLNLIQGGSHAKWRNAEGKTVTVGPRHGKNPGLGLLRAIEGQVIRSLESKQSDRENKDCSNVALTSRSGSKTESVKSEAQKMNKKKINKANRR